MSSEKYYERIEWSEIMKEINYTCAHMDFNKSYGCAKCEEDKKQDMNKDNMDKRVSTSSAAAKAMRKG
jgi:hypothetical protein